MRQKIQRRLLGEHNETIEVLATGVNGSTTTIALTIGDPMVGPGVVLEIDTEQMFVLTRTSNTLNVLRGWGSDAASHAQHSVIRVNPRFSNLEISELIAEEIMSWPPELGIVSTEEIDVPDGDWTVPIGGTSPIEITRFLGARLLPRAGETSRWAIDTSLVRDRDANQYPSGWGLTFADALPAGRRIQIDYLQSYDLSGVTDANTNLVDDVGLDSRVLDIVVYGVAWRAMSMREVGRTSAAAVPSAPAEQVPPTHLSQASQTLWELRMTRISDERARMFNRFPILKSAVG